MNGQPNVGDIISFAWSKTKYILFPIQFKRWLKIFFIAWLAGQTGGFGNFNVPDLPEEKKEAVEEQAVSEQVADEPTPEDTAGPPWSSAETEDLARGPAPAAQGEESIDETSGIPQTAPAAEGETAPTEEDQVPNIPVGVWLVLIPLVLAFGLLFMWLGARFNFILLELMQNREVAIKASFLNHKWIGNSYFLWSLGFALVVIGGILLMAVFIALLAAFMKPLLWLAIPLLILWIIAAVVIGVLFLDFVLPMMYQDKIRCMEACRKFLSFKPAKGPIAIYFLVKIALGVVTAIIAFIVAFLVFLGFIILALLIGIPGALLAGAVSSLKPVLIVLGIILLIAAILAMIILIGMITLPIPIFFRAFALAYLARLIPQYDLLGFSPPTSDGPPLAA